MRINETTSAECIDDLLDFSGIDHKAAVASADSGPVERQKVLENDGYGNVACRVKDNVSFERVAVFQ